MDDGGKRREREECKQWEGEGGGKMCEGQRLQVLFKRHTDSSRRHLPPLPASQTASPYSVQFMEYHAFVLIKGVSRVWRDGSAVKGPCSSCRGPQYGSQHPHQVTQQLQIQGTQRLLVSVGAGTHIAHTHRHTNQHVECKINLRKRDVLYSKYLYLCNGKINPLGIGSVGGGLGQYVQHGKGSRDSRNWLLLSRPLGLCSSHCFFRADLWLRWVCARTMLPLLQVFAAPFGPRMGFIFVSSSLCST